MNGAVKQGEILFLHSEDGDFTRAKEYLTRQGWDFGDASGTKELNLTHNLIAGKAGFGNLMDIYDNDPVIGLKNDIPTKIKDKKRKAEPEIPILEDDSFEVVVNKFSLRKGSKNGPLKKESLLQDLVTADLYNQLKDQSFRKYVRFILARTRSLTTKSRIKTTRTRKVQSVII